MYIKLSKYLSYLLRHNPEDLDLSMDNNGWVSCEELIEKIQKQGRHVINMDILKLIVKDDDKQRYAFSKDGEYIRANQGHSINVNMEYTPVKPPEYLYHGTNSMYVGTIMKSGGLHPMTRQYVHLSEDIETATSVAMRHGPKPFVFYIDSEKMYNDGIEFYKSENNIWLVKYVPIKYMRQA